MNHERLIECGLDYLRAIPFVEAVKWKPGRDEEESEIRIKLSRSEANFVIKVKNVHLSHSLLNAFLAEAKKDREHPRLLIANHITREAAQELISAGVAFVDSAGNAHLSIGKDHNWTSLGRPNPHRSAEPKGITASRVQLLFLFATFPETLRWPLRKVSELAGVGKSAVAIGRKQLEQQGTISQGKAAKILLSSEELKDRLLRDYIEVLRPKLVLGRFRFIDKSPEEFLRRLPSAATENNFNYVLTGSWAAELKNPFYRTNSVSLYAEEKILSKTQQLKLLKTSDGPLTVLRIFGSILFHEKLAGHFIAPPWLVYCEMMSLPDSRAHEAAQLFWERCLSQ